MFKKSLISYFHKDSEQWASRPLDEAPATTFLHSVVEICESVRHCAKTFSHANNSRVAEKNSASLQIFTMSAFALLMSHFEAFQKAQFAEIINALDFIECVDDLNLAKRLEKEGCVLSLHRILAGRGDPREPGQIVADALSAWHNPVRVNNYFRIIFPKINIYSNDAITELELMWQLRHSIVHTAGVITREDVAKVAALRRYNDRKLVLEDNFMSAVGRRFHVIVKHATELLEKEVRPLFRPAPVGEDNEGLISALVGCESPKKSWF